MKPKTDRDAQLKPNPLKVRGKKQENLSDSEDYNLTESLSSITRWGLAGVAGLVPFIRLYWVNKIFMVASRTSDKLCLIYTKERKREDSL